MREGNRYCFGMRFYLLGCWIVGFGGIGLIHYWTCGNKSSSYDYLSCTEYRWGWVLYDVVSCCTYRLLCPIGGGSGYDYGGECKLRVKGNEFIVYQTSSRFSIYNPTGSDQHR